MTRKKLEDNSGESSQGPKVGKGAYVRKCTITAIEDMSSYPNCEEKYFKSGSKTEICLIVKFKPEDYDKERSTFIFGKFKKNAQGIITAWDPWNNNVQRLLYKLLGDQAEIDENLKIPDDVINKLIGKEFQYVNYVSGKTYQADDGEKNSYQVWGKIFTIDQPLEEIEAEWISNLQWIKDYSPESLEQHDKSTSFKPSDFDQNTQPAQTGSQPSNEEPLI